MSRVSGKLISNNSIYQLLIQQKYIILLIFANLIANFLFLFQYKFYSDDWSVIVHPFGSSSPFSYYILFPDRPIYFVLLKFQALVFHDAALVYHILGFVTTSIILVLIYKIASKIFSDFGHDESIFPFLAALLFCVFCNKDELYPWALVALGFYSIMYLLSFYFYIHKERPYFLVYSLITYTVGIFTYESGITLPVVFFFYDIFLKKDYKKSFLFAIPLIFNLLVRKTVWFGFGSVPYLRDFGQWGVFELLHNTIDFISASVFITIRQILFAFYGLFSMGWLIIPIAVVIIAFLWVLSRNIQLPDIPWRRDWNLSLFILVIILSFSAPFIIRGGLLSGSLPTRSFEFIDIGIALFLVYLIAIFGKPYHTKIILLVFVGISVFLCQGLFMNWVVAGDLQTDVYNFIGDNSNEISSYDYIYFNTSSFIIHRPNSIDESVFYPVARIYYKYIRNDIRALEQRIKNSQQASAGSGINEYDRYFNAKGLDNYALADMLSKQTGKFDNRNYASYLIYGKNMNVPVNVSPNSITFQQDYPGGKNITVDRSRIYEINYEMIYPTS